MKVSINGSPCEVPPGVASFGDLLFFVEQQRLPPGEVLTAVVLDGQELTTAEEEDAGGRACSELGQVELFTAPPLELARAGLEDATELLDGLAEGLRAAAQLLRAGQVAQALEVFDPCLEVLSWYTGLLGAVDALLARHDPDLAFTLEPLEGDGGFGAEVDHDGTGLTGSRGELRSFASIENLRQKLVDIELAQDAASHTELADLLQYELLPIVELWEGELPQLLARLNKEDALA